jgi:hypothetical protein
MICASGVSANNEVNSSTMYFSVSHPRLYLLENSRYFSANFETAQAFELSPD